jgi:hypothetical protein
MTWTGQKEHHIQFQPYENLQVVEFERPPRSPSLLWVQVAQPLQIQLCYWRQLLWLPPLQNKGNHMGGLLFRLNKGLAHRLHRQALAHQASDSCISSNWHIHHFLPTQFPGKLLEE